MHVVRSSSTSLSAFISAHLRLIFLLNDSGYDCRNGSAFGAHIRRRAQIITTSNEKYRRCEKQQQ